MKPINLALLACLIAACQTAAPTPEPAAEPVSEAEQRLREVDARFDKHIAETALPVGATTAELKSLLGPKADSVRELQDAYAAFATSDDRAAYAHAALRTGQLYLNLGCELATLKPASNPAVASQIQKALEEQASPFLTKSRQAFGKATTDGAGEYADTASSLVGLVAPDDVGSSCRATEDYWLVDNRPAGKSAQDLTAEACDDLPGASEDCRPIYLSRCETTEKGDGRACLHLGQLDHEAQKMNAAREHFERGCELGDTSACRAAMLMGATPEENRASCKAGDAVACMQLAKSGDNLSKVGQMCSTPEVLEPPGSKTLAQCMGDDAIACWKRAGELIRETPYDMPDTSAAVFALGGLKGSMAKESRDEWRAKLTEECAQNRTHACVQLGDLMQKDGDDPRPMFRKGCELGSSWGCQKLSAVLLESGDTDDVAEAVGILHDSCVEGRQGNCTYLAKLFHAGEKVPQSDGCAAAYGWQACSPVNLLACENLNRAYHPSESATE